MSVGAGGQADRDRRDATPVGRVGVRRGASLVGRREAGDLADPPGRLHERVVSGDAAGRTLPDRLHVGVQTGRSLAEHRACPRGRGRQLLGALAPQVDLEARLGGDRVDGRTAGELADVARHARRNGLGQKASTGLDQPVQRAGRPLVAPRVAAGAAVGDPVADRTHPRMLDRIERRPLDGDERLAGGDRQQVARAAQVAHALLADGGGEHHPACRRPLHEPARQGDESGDREGVVADARSGDRAPHRVVIDDNALLGGKDRVQMSCEHDRRPRVVPEGAHHIADLVDVGLGAGLGQHRAHDLGPLSLGERGRRHGADALGVLDQPVEVARRGHEPGS